MTKILLVEDDKSLREIYGVRLLAEGYDIVSAGDGEEALAMAIKEKPTLIISDVMMPKISGFDMLDILRSTTETRDIKVIMMTALSSDDQRARGEQLGADRYLVKSQVGIEDVVRTVHEVLGDPAGGSAPVAAAAAAPANTESTPVTTDVADAKPAEETTPETPAAAEEASTEEAPAPSASNSAPGNEDAGPLPPQPTETSSLPQPTAPFSSPRPSTLGEQIVHPDDETVVAGDDVTPPVTPEVSDQLAQELTASAEPVASTQVDDVDAAAPAVDSAVPSLDTATTPAPEVTATPDLSTPVVTPTEETTPPSVTPGSTPPTISGTSSPIS